METGVQRIYNSWKELDSGFRRNDGKTSFLTFYEIIKEGLRTECRGGGPNKSAFGTGLIMHELSVTQSILEIALDFANRHQAARIVVIHLQVGEITDFDDEWMQRYFDFISRGTLAEGAKLNIQRVAAKLQCNQCASVFPFDKKTWNRECPFCRSKETQLISGREFRVESLEIN